jgi:hypothetical protein
MVARYVMQKITWVLGMLPLDQSVQTVGAYIKLSDYGLNELIKLAARRQFMNLVMEGPADQFMNDVSCEEDDYEDWLK